MAREHGNDDRALLRRAATDPRAFGSFYQRHAHDLLSYCHRRTRDPDVAADLVAESFAIALEQLDRFDPERGEPVQWLYGITNNQLRRFWRTQKVADRARQRLGIPAIDLDEASATAISSIDDAMAGAPLLAALERLPHRLREAVRLRIVDGLDYPEIADVLGCSPGNARVRVFRGLRRLEESVT